jgi:hypothetical protein
MRTLYLLVVINVALILSACTSNEAVTNYKPAPNDPRQDPIKISYNKPPSQPYQVIGLASVSKYNDEGIKRQEATVRDLMREQAASLHGDAIIDVKNVDQSVTATVIAYKQQALV